MLGQGFHRGSQFFQRHGHHIQRIERNRDPVHAEGGIECRVGELAHLTGTNQRDDHAPPEEDKLIPTVCHSLDQALEYLDGDRAFLTKGGVFTDAYIDAYIDLKMTEVTRFRMATHPVEFDMYYSL